MANCNKKALLVVYIIFWSSIVQSITVKCQVLKQKCKKFKNPICLSESCVWAKPQSTYNGRVEIGGVHLPQRRSTLSAGAYTTALYVMIMVDIVKGGGRRPPPPSRLGWFFHHDGMYAARKWPLPLCVCTLWAKQRTRQQLI